MPGSDREQISPPADPSTSIARLRIAGSGVTVEIHQPWLDPDDDPGSDAVALLTVDFRTDGHEAHALIPDEHWEKSLARLASFLEDLARKPAHAAWSDGTDRLSIEATYSEPRGVTLEVRVRSSDLKAVGNWTFNGVVDRVVSTFASLDVPLDDLPRIARDAASLSRAYDAELEGRTQGGQLGGDPSSKT